MNLHKLKATYLYKGIIYLWSAWFSINRPFNVMSVSRFDVINYAWTRAINLDHEHDVDFHRFSNITHDCGKIVC